MSLVSGGSAWVEWRVKLQGIKITQCLELDLNRSKTRPKVTLNYFEFLTKKNPRFSNSHFTGCQKVGGWKLEAHKSSFFKSTHK